MPRKGAKFFLKGEEVTDKALEQMLSGGVGKADGVFGQALEASY